MPEPSADRSRLPLAVSLAGLGDTVGAGRSGIEWAARAGITAVQLDAAVRGMRARELDRSARRDLAAILRRFELEFSGLDLWIPPGHFESADHADRAIEATAAALGLAADLADLAGGHAIVSVVLPASLPDTTRIALEEAASRAGARLADHAPSPGQRPASHGIAIGIDPAAILAAGGDPSQRTIEAAPNVVSARLSDWDGVGRAEIGRWGRLDLTAYRAALSVAAPESPVVVDLRTLRDPGSGLRAALDAWEASASVF